MKRVLKYYTFLNEDLSNELSQKLSDDYLSLKKGILDIIEKSIDNPEELINVQNFIHNYINEETEETLSDFVEDAEIYDFYLKYQVDIDDLLQEEIDFFNNVPKDEGIYSLYDYVIFGTKEAVKEAMKKIYEEVFEV